MNQEPAQQVDPVNATEAEAKAEDTTTTDETVGKADPGIVTKENEETPSAEVTPQQAAEQGDPDAEDDAGQEASTVEAQEEETVEAAEVDSIQVATKGTLSNLMRAQMEHARDNVPPERRQSPLYQEAAAIEARALQLQGARVYLKAASLFDEAHTLYQKAAAEVVKEEVPPALEQAINSFAETLKVTLETKDAGTMSAMFYRGRDWRAFFETAGEITAVVRPGPVQVAGKTATVLIEADLTYHNAQAQPEQETLKHLWTIKNMGGDWIPTKVVAQQ